MDHALYLYMNVIRTGFILVYLLIMLVPMGHLTVDNGQQHDDQHTCADHKPSPHSEPENEHDHESCAICRLLFIQIAHSFEDGQIHRAAILIYEQNGTFSPYEVAFQAPHQSRAPPHTVA